MHGCRGVGGDVCGCGCDAVGGNVCVRARACGTGGDAGDIIMPVALIDAAEPNRTVVRIPRGAFQKSREEPLRLSVSALRWSARGLSQLHHCRFDPEGISARA